MAKKSRVVGIPTTEHKWQAESDLRTLMEATEIKRDKRRFGAAQKLAKDRLADIAKVAGEPRTGD